MVYDLVGVTEPVPNGAGQNPPLTATGSLTSIPSSAKNYTWKITGGGGAIVFSNGAETIQSTTDSIQLFEPNPTGSSVPFTLEADVANPSTIGGTLEYGPAPEMFGPKVPQVTFPALIGIPQGGQASVTVEFSPSGATSPVPITYTLSTATGETGAVTFADGTTSFQSSTAPTLIIKGVTASTHSRDVTLKASVQDTQFGGVGLFAELSFSVVNVTLSVLTSGDVPTTYPKSKALPTTHLSAFAIPVVVNRQSQYLCSASFFVTAAVKPADYPGPINLNRNIVTGEQYVDPGNLSQVIQPGPDVGPNVGNYSTSEADSFGNVYDWDAPGPLQVDTSSGTPVGTQARSRANFSEYATMFEFSNSEKATAVGTPYAIFSRESCLKLALGSGSALDTTYNANGDNQAGNGTTPISKSLQ